MPALSTRMAVLLAACAPTGAALLAAPRLARPIPAAALARPAPAMTALDITRTRVSLEGFTFGHTRLELKAVANQGETPGFDRLIDESRCFYGPDTVAEFDLPYRNAGDMPVSEVLDQSDPAQRAAFLRSVSRGQMIKALCANESEPSVAGRHFRLVERRDKDQDRALEAKVRGGFPENLSRVIVRSRVSVAYEEVFPGAPGAASFLRDLHALQTDEAFHDCVLRGATSEGSVDVGSCRFLLAARSSTFARCSSDRWPRRSASWTSGRSRPRRHCAAS